MRSSMRTQLISAIGFSLVFLVLMSAPASGGSTPKAKVEYYVSVGDSYAAGYQPVASALRGKDTAGFAYQVIRLVRTRGYHFKLVNFGCGGATTSSIIEQVGCSISNPGPDTDDFPNLTQANAVDQFITRHAGHIGLITVSISGNDILACTNATILLPCVTSALDTIKSNMSTLLVGLRQAAGPSVPIIGLTYPDVFLGSYTLKVPNSKELAALSVGAFRTLLNPALATLYASIDAHFIDVTQATGAYTPFNQTTRYGKYGTIPVAVADVCSLTYECQIQDPHPTTKGYEAMARLIVAALPEKH
jgi:lysophospholipase L1-like esterase